MIDPTDLISATREGFARSGLCFMHQTDMIDHDGEVVPIVIVSPVAWENGIGIQYELLNGYSSTPESIVEGVTDAARNKGIIN